MKSSGKVTVKDIARKLNVSLSTVNKALTGKTGVSEKRRCEIIEVAKEMGYEVNHVAQALSRKPINIGIIIPKKWKNYFSPIENGMKSELSKLSHSNVNGEFIYITQTSDILPALRHFTLTKADLIIYCPSLIALDDAITKYIQDDICPPVILAGADCESIKSVCTVSIDSAFSGKMAADLGRYNIPTNCIAPAAIMTDMVKESNLNDPDFDNDFFIKQITPIKRWGKPEEVADFAFRVRKNCIRMTNHGQSGHVGSMLSMAEIITVLYNGILKNVSADNPDNPLREQYGLGVNDIYNTAKAMIENK